MSSNKWVTALIFFLICSVIFAYKEYSKFINFTDGLLHVYFLNIGQGDGFLIKTPDKKLILIDGGPDDAVLFRLGEILPFWINKIGIVLISHFHKDHYVGGYYAYKALGGVVYHGSANNPDNLQVDFPFGDSSLIEKASIVYEEADLSLIAYPPSRRNFSSSENDETVLYYLVYKDFDVLFTGDATVPIQKEIDIADVDILKVPHQGSRYDLLPSFVDQLSPLDAVVSVGPNSYGHPHKEVLDFYRSRNINLHRTDESTNFILIRSNGFSYNFSYH